MAITLTDAAADRVKSFLQQRGKGLGLRLGVRTSGCSGMAYVLEFVDELAGEDQVFEGHGVKVFVDAAAIMFLIGSEMDYLEDKLESRFVFNNPNAKNVCGCGESFSV